MMKEIAILESCGWTKEDIEAAELFYWIEPIEHLRDYEVYKDFWPDYKNDQMFKFFQQK